MLHLLPVRQILSAVIALMGFGMLIAFSAGYLGSGDGLADILAIFRWSFAAAIALPLAASVAWRFAPVLQNATFPYLGGKWQGHLSFDGQYGSGARDVKLEIRHGLFGLNLMLDSPQATSRTLVAHAEYDAGLDRRRIYYVYLNERKEGVTGAGEHYKGLATLRIEDAGSVLSGEYFTEARSAGTIHARRICYHSPWRFWK